MALDTSNQMPRPPRPPPARPPPVSPFDVQEENAHVLQVVPQARTDPYMTSQGSASARPSWNRSHAQQAWRCMDCLERAMDRSREAAAAATMLARAFQHEADNFNDLLEQLESLGLGFTRRETRRMS